MWVAGWWPHAPLDDWPTGWRISLATDSSKKLDWNEYYGGEGKLTREVLRQRLKGKIWDMQYSCLQNTLSPDGFRRWLNSQAMSRKGAQQWFGLTCTTWTVMCRATMGRSEDLPWGFEDRPNVSAANEQLLCYVIQAVHAHLLSQGTVLECPVGSAVLYVPIFTHCLHIIGGRFIVTYLGAYGSSTCKPVKLYFSSKAGWVQGLATERPASGSLDTLAVSFSNKSGRAAMTGKKDVMSRSAAYPDEFAKKASQFLCQHIQVF